MGCDMEWNPDREEKLQTIFKKHFESHFKPLPKPASQQPQRADACNEGLAVKDDESDWDGLSNSESEQQTEMIEYNLPTSTKRSDIPREELKSFMTPKPPLYAKKPIARPNRHKSDQDEEEAVTDAANLKKDLALQRLLKESHLLGSDGSLSLSGVNRHKALDMRLQNLGSKSSILVQDKMPLAHRKGITAKAIEREERRRREAKENGIILAKVAGGPERKTQNRSRGVGGPNVGRFKGGMLSLSKKDVAEIQGPRRVVKSNRASRP